MQYFDSEKPNRIVRSIKSSTTNLTKTISDMIKSSSNAVIHTLSDKNEIFLIFINIIFFMVVQTIFFHKIISVEYDALLKEKTNTVQYYISKDENILKSFEKNKKEYLNDNREKAKEQEEERGKINMTLYWYYCIIPILCVLFVFIIIILFVNFSKSLTWTQFFNFFLVFFVYTPEIIVFLYVVKKYQFIGNIDITSRIYNTLTKK
jgi:uncharacterized membrane protein